MSNVSSYNNFGYNLDYTKSTLPQEIFPYARRVVKSDEDDCQEMHGVLAKYGLPTLVSFTTFGMSALFAMMIFGTPILYGAPALPMIFLGSVAVLTTTSSLTAYVTYSLFKERQKLRDTVNDNKTISLTGEEINILLDQELKMAKIENRVKEKEDSFELEIQEGEEK